MPDAQPLAQQAGAVRPGRHRRRPVRQLGLGRQLDPVRAQEVREGLPVPELFVYPAGQERGHVGIARCPGREQVSQVYDGVGLDVHHVVHAHHVPIREWVVGDVVPVDLAQVEAPRVAQVAVDVEFDLSHCKPASRSGDPEGQRHCVERLLSVWAILR